MVDLALRHLSDLKDKLYGTWYDPKYEYFYGQRSRYDVETPDLVDRSETFIRRAFVSINNGEIIGYIAYSIDTSIGLAYGLELLNFSKKKSDMMVFSVDTYEVLRECFIKYNCNTIAFHVFIGNPIEKSYDRICERMGGSIVGIEHKRGIKFDGTLLDKKIYEITKEGFMEKRRNKSDEGEG